MLQTISRANNNNVYGQLEPLLRQYVRKFSK